MPVKRPEAGANLAQMLPGEAGPIEAILQAPRDAVARPGIAVICHPHPFAGGAMSNKLTWMLASAALRVGLLAVRFNFRGVGRSAGAHDNGRGERADTERVAATLRELEPDGPLLLAGFSFGADVAIAAAQALSPTALVTVAPPLHYLDAPAAWRGPECPWQLLHARDDDVVPYERTQQRLAAYERSPEIVSFDTGGHFFHGSVNTLRDAVMPFLQARLGAA